MITWSCQSVWLRNTHRLARHWQTHLPDVTADSNSLLNQADVQYESGTGGSAVEKPAETQTSIQLASHLVIERLTLDLKDMSLNPLCGRNLVNWLKRERPLGSGLSTLWRFLTEIYVDLSQTFLHVPLFRSVRPFSNVVIAVKICHSQHWLTSEENDKKNECLNVPSVH